jgi:exosortase
VSQKVSVDLSAKLCVPPRSSRLCVKGQPGFYGIAPAQMVRLVAVRRAAGLRPAQLRVFRINVPALTLMVLLAPSWLGFAWLATKASWFWRHDPEFQFGWAVLVLCVYLFARAWAARPRVRLKWSVGNISMGLLGCGLLFITQLYQAAYGLTPASMSGLGVGFLLVVGANLSFVWGWPGLRQFGFAFGFLLVAVPIPSLIGGPVVGALQQQLAAVNVEVLNLVGIPAVQTGHLVAIAAGTVGIDEACSGIRSLRACLMISLFLGQLHHFGLGRRFGLVIAGFGLAVFFNLIRTFSLVCIASQSGFGALGKWHELTGTGLLVVCFMSLWGLSSWLHRPATPKTVFVPGASIQG